MVPRIENRNPGSRENYCRVPGIREIESLQDQTGYLTFSFKKTDVNKARFQIYKNSYFLSDFRHKHINR